jgi:hypothetical protein
MCAFSPPGVKPPKNLRKFLTCVSTLRRLASALGCPRCNRVGVSRIGDPGSKTGDAIKHQHQCYNTTEGQYLLGAEPNRSSPSARTSILDSSEDSATVVLSSTQSFINFSVKLMAHCDMPTSCQTASAQQDE